MTSDPSLGGSGKAAIPGPALALGAAGFLPFLALSIATFVAPTDLAALSQKMLFGYGAVILSFLGGIHWGRVISGNDIRWPVLAIGVLPSLAGWAALFVPAAPGTILLVTGFAVTLAYDMGVVRAGQMPRWYPRLRVPLTAAVCAALLVPLFA
ncbi:DUF3429 domain-containing protein [Roseibium sp.]|uniref:DUF3429 domain-containing protein n=1 Tax=Roseibium sp. TaxID=1936156 RepID=UPI003A9776EB